MSGWAGWKERVGGYGVVGQEKMEMQKDEEEKGEEKKEEKTEAGGSSGETEGRAGHFI